MTRTLSKHGIAIENGVFSFNKEKASAGLRTSFCLRASIPVSSSRPLTSTCHRNPLIPLNTYLASRDWPRRLNRLRLEHRSYNMDSRRDASGQASVSRPSSANETSDDTATETADEKPVHDEPQEDNPITAATTNEPVYLEGLPLFLVVACVTLVCFLVLLDTSIIATVSIVLWTLRREALLIR